MTRASVVSALPVLAGLAALTLQNGEHTITLRDVDPSGLSGEDEVVITIAKRRR